MELRWLLVVCAVTVVRAATVNRGVRDIPVMVLYEEPALVKGLRNLDDQVIPFSAGEMIREEVMKKSNEIISSQRGVQNLHEKVQLSPDELGLATRYLPAVEDGFSLIVKSNPEKSEAESEIVPKQLKDRQDIAERAEEIIYSGLKAIRENVDKISSTIHERRPTEENWRQLNKTLDEFLRNELQKTPVRQDGGQNQFIQNIINGFQNFTGGFIQQFNQPQVSQPGNGSADEQQPSQGGFFQSLQNYWSSGVQQIANNLSNLNPQNSSPATVLGDTGVTPPNGFFGGFVSQVQQIFSGPNQNQQTTNLNQSDTGTDGNSNQGPAGFFQGAIQQINQVVNNFRPTPTPAPGSQGDEGTTPTTPGGPIQIFQQIGNQVGQAFNQFASNFGGQQSGQKPGNEDEGTGGSQQQQQQPTNFIQNVGQVFQNINPFKPPTKPAQPQNEGETASSSNPIQNVGSQIQQFVPGQGQGNSSNPIQNVGSQIQQLIPGQGQGNSSNPIQNVGSQIQQLVQGQGQGGSNPLENFGSQIQQLGPGGGDSSNNPIVAGIQQVGQGFGGNNPLGGGNNPLSGGSNPLTGGNNPLTSGNNPLTSGNNPLTGGNNPFTGGNNPLTDGNNPIGSAINQIGGQGNGGNNPIGSAINQLGGQSNGGNNPIGSAINQLGGQGNGGDNPIGSAINQLGGQSGGDNNPIGSAVNQLGGQGKQNNEPITKKAPTQRDDIVIWA